MFYYKDLNDFLIKSSKELDSDKLTKLTEEQYEELLAAAAYIAPEEVDASEEDYLAALEELGVSE